VVTLSDYKSLTSLGTVAFSLCLFSKHCKAWTGCQEARSGGLQATRGSRQTRINLVIRPGTCSRRVEANREKSDSLVTGKGAFPFSDFNAYLMHIKMQIFFSPSVHEYGSLDVSQPCGPPLPATRIALPFGSMFRVDS
jgi:hypothetical protein